MAPSLPKHPSASGYYLPNRSALAAQLLPAAATTPARLTGDKGVAGKAELQYNQQLSRLGSALQYFGFYDAGVIGNSDPAAGIPHSQSLASTGGGVRFALPLGFSGSREWMHPLTKPVEAEVILDNPHPKDPGLSFLL